MAHRFQTIIGCAGTIGAFALAVVMIPELHGLAAREAMPQDLRLAYIDPGTGGLVVQAIVATVATVAVTMRATVRAYWRRFKGLFGGGAKEKAASEPAAQD